MIRHFLATLAYRFQKAVRDAPPEFGDFHAGHGVRTPAEIVRHMSHDLMYVLRYLIEMEVTSPQPLDWDGEITRFHDLLGQIDEYLAKHTQPEGTTLEELLQGPLSDVMTHIGQIAMLRRMAGSPIRGESFRVADIAVGRVGPDQPDRVKAF
ncbi:hypothetical protein GWO43_09580 [candidate division KSB1 bacterium]|nr:hypothetical protein [candidate division KSB1 bacterium]NIR69419.1 hypothetical protein [candidate division KSB1 bacterium]NIS24217.1 hypothetical protein [candidate division KSB1 bacterium]NIT71131.1 hypothetical protein [candidate division KSB1 bacterium]NIU24836.1 hypothetical protein [candidate division KSB1 bacterium]